LVGAGGIGDTNITTTGNGTAGGTSTVNTGTGGFSGIAHSAGGGATTGNFAGAAGGTATGGTTSNLNGDFGTNADPCSGAGIGGVSGNQSFLYSTVDNPNEGMGGYGDTLIGGNGFNGAIKFTYTTSDGSLLYNPASSSMRAHHIFR
jgi:hypothetical protein